MRYRPLAAAVAALLAAPAGADWCASPNGAPVAGSALTGVQLTSVPQGGCVAPAVLTQESAIERTDQGDPWIVWDPALGGPRPLTDAEKLAGARDACRDQALADWRAVRDGAWLPDDLTAMGLSGMPEADREAAVADSVLLLRVRSALGITGGGVIQTWTLAQLALCGNSDSSPAAAAARAALYDWDALLTAAEAETSTTRSARLAAAVGGAQ